MRDLNRGFRVDDRFIPWGTLLAEAGRQLCCDADATSFACRSIYGFPALCAALNGPARDRPVLGISVELALPQGGRIHPEHWADVVTAALGPPVKASRWDVSPHADPGDCVVYSANWRGGGFAVALSVYGGPREVETGRSAGILWVNWDEELAAQPFIAGWQARRAALEARAAAISDLRTYSIAEPQYPRFGNQPEARRALSLCLHDPGILATPAVIAKKLNPRRFALWTDPRDGFWGLSTPWDTLAYAAGTPVKASWIELLPAKGGGCSMLEIGSWAVRSGVGSRDIREAAEALKRIPGVSVDFHQSYDC